MEESEAGVWRILDAAGNRALEGLRTLEDYARFVLDDAGLARSAKELRHEVRAGLERLPRQPRLQMRDTPGDVGTTIDVPAESERKGAAAVAAAAASRAQQALRSLEEYAKVIAPAAAGHFEAARYRSYALAAAIELLPQRGERMRGALLYVLVEGGESDQELAARVGSLAEAGADVIQLRDKGLDDRTLYRRAVAAVAALRETGTPLIINDRADVAVAAGADGVHVGQQELPVAAARRVVGPMRLVGVSSRSIEQAHQAVLDGADYLGCGPAFPSTTKRFAAEDYVGVALLSQVAAEVRLPTFAIGGISPENLDEVLQAGIRRVAVAGAVRGEGAATVAQLKRRLVAAAE